MGKEEVNFDATTPRYLVERELRERQHSHRTQARTDSRVRTTILLAVTTIPFILFGIAAGKHLYLATYKVAGETAVLFSSQAKAFDTPNTGQVIEIRIVGDVDNVHWIEKRKLEGLGYSVRVLPRKYAAVEHEGKVVYRVDSSLGTDVFDSFGSLCDNLEAISKITGEVK
jgi:hypothetical protein